MARPRIKINWDEFDKLCEIQCTQVEIAQWFRCTVDTIENACKREKLMGFSEYYEQKSGVGKISLRRKQFQLALKGDKCMLIWLGKQYLRQAEKIDQRQVVAQVAEPISEEEFLSLEKKYGREY